MPSDSESIAAIATAPGRGGIGIVRVSGKNIDPLMLGILGKIPEPRRAVRSGFFDAEGQTLDEGLAIYFTGPASFTGEDTLELQAHGGPVVLQMILDRCLELGSRAAKPGEFTQRAFLNDKMDLAQAEAVADLINASTTVSARCAMRSLSGDFSRSIKSVVFSEEEIEAKNSNDLIARLMSLRNAIDQTIERGRRGSVLRNGLNVVIVGRPNMGKSSLLNVLVGEDVAIVTAIPGTTRDAIRQTINIEGVPLNIIDTAGLRDTPDEVEILGIGKTWEMVEHADVVMLIVEAGVGIQHEDEVILSKFPQSIARMVVHNKLDLTSGEAERKIEMYGDVLRLSAKTGEGVDLLRAALLEKAGWISGDEDVFMARARHLEALTRGSEYLHRAVTVTSHMELFAEELRLAQFELCTITGEFVADDLLGEIFSRFCIGK